MLARDPWANSPYSLTRLAYRLPSGLTPESGPLTSAHPGVIQEEQEEQDCCDTGFLRWLLKHPHLLRPLDFFPTARLLRALSRSKSLTVKTAAKPLLRPELRASPACTDRHWQSAKKDIVHPTHWTNTVDAALSASLKTPETSSPAPPSLLPAP